MNTCDTPECVNWHEGYTRHCILHSDPKECSTCTCHFDPKEASVPVFPKEDSANDVGLATDETGDDEEPAVFTDKAMREFINREIDGHVTREDILSSRKLMDEDLEDDPINHPQDYHAGKQDQGKPRFDLLDPYFENEIAQILEFGCRKYSANSWQKVENALERYIAAMRRHLFAVQIGEYIDPDSGLPHHAHASCNMMFISYLVRLDYEEKQSCLLKQD